MGVYIKDMEMPLLYKTYKVRFAETYGGKIVVAIANEGSTAYMPVGEAVPVPPHGRLVDADALIEELKQQCKEVFRIDAVSQDDFWITRDKAYNQRLWQTWCEGFYEYVGSRPTIIPENA